MKRLVFVMAILLLQTLTTNVFAGERTKEEMKMAALNALSFNNKTRGVASEASDLKEYLTKEKLSVFGSEDLGFAVITNDDRFDEVIGYSVSKFSETMPCGFKWWLETVDKNMQSINKPVSQKSKTRGTSSSAGPLLTTKWGQERPYNHYCTFTNGKYTYQCVTGCVATAMAQVMNYYKYPEHGTGSYSYEVIYNDAFTITFSEDFSKSVYDWNNMLDDYTSYYYNRVWDSHTDAVAKLMKDCGVSVNMVFSDASHGSGSNIRWVEYALKTYFYYNEATKYYNRCYYQKSEWMNILYDALDKGRPIVYSGQISNKDGADGHAFVLHGYDSSGKVLVNWGWDGNCDGYFDIDLLNPSNYNFSYQQCMVIAIPGNTTLVPQMHTLTITAIGSGCVYYKSLEGTKVCGGSRSFQIEDGSSVDLFLSPDASYKIKSVKVNNNDVTSAIVNNKYTLTNVISSADIVVEFEKIPVNPVNPQCAVPSINYVNGEISFSCDTEGVKYISEISVSDAKEYSGSQFKISKIYKVSVYATKDGYKDSEQITREFLINSNSVKGDVDGNGVVNEADHLKLSDIILRKN